MDTKMVRNHVPTVCLQDFDDIVTGRSLGASNHIRMISNMFRETAKVYPIDKAKEIIKEIGDFFKETRGNSSYAIITALNRIQKLIDCGVETEFDKRVSLAIDQYFLNSDEDIARILKYTDRLLKNIQTIMIYDYSSTVEKAVAQCSHLLKVYIPESRVINGGYPFVKKIVEAGHQVHFIPDASMLSVLNEVEMAFIGAETFYPDGTAFNTIGSDILAELCSSHNIPYYVLTPLLKNDMRALYGIYKPVLKKNLSETMAKEWPDELKEKVSFTSIELVGVQPKFITGYVTEKGILRPTDLMKFVYEEDADV